MSKEDEILTQLEKLSEAKSKQANLALEKEKLIEGLIPPEVKAEIDAVRTTYAKLENALSEELETLEKSIKLQVVLHGKSLDGYGHIAVFNPPRVSYDTKKLDGYAVAHPEILAFREVGNASVTIRKSTKKG